MTKESKKSIFQRVFVIGAGVAFLGMMTIPMLAGLFNNSSASNQQGNNPVAASQENQELQQIAEGYEAVVAREPNNINALQKLAEIRITMQDYEAAAEPVKKLMELDPENPQYLIVLLQLYQQTNNVNAASQLKEKIENLVATEADNPQYLQILAQFYQQTNDQEGAKELTNKLENLVNSQPENPQYLAILVTLYQQTNNQEGAKELVQRVQSLSESQPQNPQYLQLLGQLQLQSNDLNGAIETMKKIQVIYPEDEQIKIAIEKLEAEVAKRNSITVPGLPDLSLPESSPPQP